MLLIFLFVTACGSDAKTKYVFESKGAIQCEYSGMAPEESAQTLIDADIDVISTFCSLDTRTDNMTVCGAGTSVIIVHEIDNDNVSTAEELGFQDLDILDGNYLEIECSEVN